MGTSTAGSGSQWILGCTAATDTRRIVAVACPAVGRQAPPLAVMGLNPLLSVLAPPLCWHCGAPATKAQPLCSRCRSELRWLGLDTATLGGVAVWAPVAYDGPARAVVRALKFHSATGVAESMAAQVAARAPEGLLTGATLVPVPLHPARLRRRGFNQAERLARALSARTGLPVAPCLERIGPSSRQIGRSRNDRASAVRGAVRARTEAPARATLVDDVATTGATLAACAAALRGAGARQVAALAYGRTPPR
jgi:ComF family protein